VGGGVLVPLRDCESLMSMEVGKKEVGHEHGFIGPKSMRGPSS